MFLKINIFKLCLFFLFGVLWISPPAQAGESYPYVFLGDGQPGTSVSMTLVDGITTDLEGNIYISHRSQNRIRKLSPDGIITNCVKF